MKSKLIGILLGLAPLLICAVAKPTSGLYDSHWSPNIHAWYSAIILGVLNTVFNFVYKTENHKVYYYAVVAVWLSWAIYPSLF